MYTLCMAKYSIYQETARPTIVRGHPELTITRVLFRREWREVVEHMGYSVEIPEAQT